MIWVLGILALVGLIYIVRFYIVRNEIKRILELIDKLSENARYGMRLHLEENDRGLADIVEAINRMVDEYESKLKKADEMARSIRHSISGISHDLRTPLTSLTGYLQLLSKELLSEKQRKYLDSISSSTLVLRELTENFYELCRIELGEMALNLQAVNFGQTVCDCLLEFTDLFERNNLDLRVQGSEMTMMVIADEIALKRVMYNIIQNLLRYATNNINVSFFDCGSYFSLVISNETAEDMPEDIERVFERFYTADPSRKNRSMGLGLYIARKLITAMGGAITAYTDNQSFGIVLGLLKKI